MAVKRQPEPETGELTVAANDWLRQFLKHLEIYIIETCRGLPSSSDSGDFRLAAMRAVKLTLVDSGMDNEEISSLFGQVAIEDKANATLLKWHSGLNKRRFELIDADIQGILTQAERIELAGLTQLMREQADTEANLPFEGSKKLHRLLMEMDADSQDLGP